MATTPTLLSIDEYLRTNYHPDADYVDGEIEKRNLGEYSYNTNQGLIYFTFKLNETAWQTDVVNQQRIRINANRVRVCDVAVLRSDDPHEEVTSTAPLICMEILSPEDRFARAKSVLADYFALGVPNIWLIDPIRRDAFTYDGAALHTVSAGKLTVRDTPIELDLDALFAELDRKIAAHERL